MAKYSIVKYYILPYWLLSAKKCSDARYVLKIEVVWPQERDSVPFTP